MAQTKGASAQSRKAKNRVGILCLIGLADYLYGTLEPSQVQLLRAVGDRLVIAPYGGLFLVAWKVVCCLLFGAVTFRAFRTPLKPYMWLPLIIASGSLHPTERLLMAPHSELVLRICAALILPPVLAVCLYFCDPWDLEVGRG